MARILRRFLSDSIASISILGAVLVAVVIGFCGLAVDTASLVYWKGRLHTATDVAAMAATFDLSRADQIAVSALQANGISDAVLAEVTVGAYTDDPAFSTGDRFQAGPPDNAVRILTTRQVPIYFMRIFNSTPSVAVSATAVAYNLPLAGIAIGTGIADADISELDAYITAQTGSTVNLTGAERDALEATDIPIFRLYDKLAVELGVQRMSIAEVMASSVIQRQLARAMYEVLSDQTTSPTVQAQAALDVLDRIAQQGNGTPLALMSKILSLAAHEKRVAEDLVSAASDDLTVPAMMLLIGYYQASNQGTLINLGTTIRIGAINVTVESVMERPGIAGGESSLAVIGPKGTSASSAQARVVLDAQLVTPISLNIPLVGMISISEIPIILDLGYGSATVSDITCGTDIVPTTDIAVTASSGVMRAYIGSATVDQLTDFVTPLVPTPVTIASLPLLSVSLSSQTLAVASASQMLHFTRADIRNGTIRSADGASAIEETMTELSGAVNLNLSNPVFDAVVTPLVNLALSTVVTALEPAIPAILGSLGLRAGYIDVQATSVRCGIPALVN